MKKTAATYPSEFEVQALSTVSMAFALCEKRIKENKGVMTPELKILAAAALALEKTVAVFIAADPLCK